MGLLFGKEKEASIDTSNYILGYEEAFARILNSKKNSQRQKKNKMQEKFYEIFDVFFRDSKEGDQLLQEKNMGIYSYSLFEKEFVKMLETKYAMQLGNINLHQITLEPNNDDDSLNTTYDCKLNSGFANHIAKMKGEDFERLVADIRKQAKEQVTKTPNRDTLDFAAQINALRSAKSKRSFGRKIKEFFNGTWLREKRMLDRAEAAMKERFSSEFAEEDRRREQERVAKEELEKAKETKQKLDIKELDPLNRSLESAYGDVDDSIVSENELEI